MVEKSHLMRAIEKTFPQLDTNEVDEMLNRYQNPFNKDEDPYSQEQIRIKLAILRLSQGNLEKLHSFIDEAKKDYRNVLMWASQPDPPKKTAEVLKKLGGWLSEQGKPELSKEVLEKASELEKKNTQQQ
jgi:Tfp pilus assembly protein PilF